ncbi:MAG TPA: Clp protease N-terminal domain-containing protein [Cryptosporangiaceae bacterium]|nr:Clp protease N-terminal domain-containing protein [Cryptosporangiaceae bacterium]
MASAVVLDDFVEMVGARAGGQDELARLDAAIAVSREAAALADHLLDHFVREARSAGLSWTQIGERLGVSKQAARVRFADRVDAPVTDLADLADLEVAPRLKVCLERAAEEARADGSAEVGTHHLLMGLMEEGLAAAVLEKLGVRVAAIRATAAALFGPPRPAGKTPPPHSGEARCALDAARRIAGQGGPGAFLGTEHLLFVLGTDPGGRTRRVLNELGVEVADIKREIACYLPPRLGRRRRRRAR